MKQKKEKIEMTGVNNSSQSFKYPTNLTIVGLGGCGKKLARKICDYDWLLRYYSRDMNKLKIYTIDTDANDYFDDLDWENKITDKVESLDGAGRIEFKSYFLPGLANISHVSDLASSDVSASIKRFRSIKSWWLHDPENSGITFQDLKNIDHFIMDDFGGGVHRRRAVSKAILYKVLSEGQTNGFPTFSTTGVTAIIVGIGGGTGSGMFIDLARYIKEKRDSAIYLFAVLPTTKEGEKEQLNAAISLTELEYLNVSHEERLFDHIIFTSLGPTEYSSGLHELEAVDEFDSVFPQIITNFFHIERSDLNLSDARKSYSSFIFADSHVIEYPVEELKELKKLYNQIIQKLEEINNDRKCINEEVEKFLIKSNINGEDTPTLEIFEFIKMEYRNIEKVWTNDIAELLKYYSVKQINEFIEYNIPEIQFEEIGSYNDLLSYISRVRNFEQSVEQDQLKDEIDKKLFRLIPEALDTLKKNASLFNRVATVENGECRSVMIDILKGKKEVSALQGAMNANNQDIQNLEDKRKPVMEEIATLSSMPSIIEKKVEDKLKDIDLELEYYAKINRNIRYLPSREQKLKGMLDQYIDKLSTGKVRDNDKNSWFLSAGIKDIRMEIEDIAKENELDLKSLSRFIDSITSYYFYKHRLKQAEKGNLRAFLLGTGKSQIKKYKEHAGKEEEYIKSNMKQWSIHIDTPFNIVIPDSFLTSDLIKKSEALQERICNSVFADLNVNNIDSDRLNLIFSYDDRVKIRQSLREYLKELHLKTANYSDKMEKLNLNIEDINGKIKKRQLQSDMLEKAEKTKTDTYTSRANLSSRFVDFHSYFEVINTKIEARDRTKKGIYTTKFGGLNPQILSLIESRSDENSTSDMSNLDMDKKGKLELDKLINLAKSTYQDLFESRKLGINSLRISIGDTERWTFGKAALVVSSTSGYVRSELMKSMINTDINQSLSLKEPKDSLLTPHGHTKPWEIALTFFASSSFLDNIYPLVAGGGYWEIYARNKDNILHHVLKLQDGEYITRVALLDSKTAGNIAKNEKVNDVPQEIMSLYKTKPLKEALKSGNK